MLEKQSKKIVFINENNEKIIMKGMFSIFVNNYSHSSLFIYYFEGDPKQIINKIKVRFTVNSTHIDDNILYLNKKNLSSTKLSRSKSDEMKKLTDIIVKNKVISELKSKNEKRLAKNKETLKKYQSVETKDMKLDDIVDFVNTNTEGKVHVKEIQGSFGIYNTLILKELNIHNLDLSHTNIGVVNDDGITVLTNLNNKTIEKLIRNNFNQSDYDLYNILERYKERKIIFDYNIINGYLAINYKIKFRKDFKSIIDLGLISILTEKYNQNEFEIML